MAFRGRRRARRPWLVYAVGVLIVLVAGFLIRQPVEAQVNRLAQVAVSIIPPAVRPATAIGTPSGALPTFTVSIDRSPPLAIVPPPEVTATRFLDDWAGGRYDDIYSLLSRDSKVGQSQDQFTQRYKDRSEESRV